MRLTTDIYVSALLRQLFADGKAGTVISKGAAQAGALFICCYNKQGQLSLYAPAPQSIFDEKSKTRIFEQRAEMLTQDELSEKIAKEQRFDPDLWLVEIETETPENYIEIVSTT